MPVFLPTARDTFEVVLSIDSALDMTEEERAKYKETHEPGLLKFKSGEEPTKFVMRKVLPYKAAKIVENEQLTVDSKGVPQFHMSFRIEEVRASLVDIINPAYLPDDQKLVLEKSNDGGATEAFASLLVSAKLIDELYNARTQICGNPNPGLLRAK